MTDFTSESEEKCLHFTGSSIDLKVALVDQKKLIITLKDFKDSNIYSKEFTEDDYSKEIHRKMELADVYNAFAQSSLQADQGHTQKVKSQVDLQFGEIVECEKNPCFKVEKGGLVTVYMGVIQKRTKKEIVYESKLVLPLVEKIGSIQWMKNALQSIGNLIQDDKNQISKLKQENKRLKAELHTLKNQKPRKNFAKFICAPFLWLFSFLAVYIKAIISFPGGCIQGIKNNIHIFFLMNMSQKNEKYFKINGTRLRYDGNYQHRQYLLNQSIKPKKITKFKLKILRSCANNIFIGIVDNQEQRNQQTFLGQYSAIWYGAKDGTKYPERVQEGDGFRTGDVVEVEVDRVGGTVKYFVNGVLKASQSNKILADDYRVFVPCIQMYNRHDSMEYLIE